MNCAVLLAVRATSTRFPKKALRMLRGKTFLEHTVARLQQAATPQRVVVCTSDEPVDDDIFRIAQAQGWDVFRGAGADVLSRYYHAAAAYNLDLIVRAQGDNVFVCPEHIDRQCALHQEAEAHWSITDGLPWGMKSEVLSFAALERAYCHAEDTSMSEYMTWYFDQPDVFTVARFPALECCTRPTYRVTVDTAEDFALVEAICAALDKDPAAISTRELVALLDARPDLVAINAGVQDRFNDAVVRKAVNTTICTTMQRGRGPAAAMER